MRPLSARNPRIQRLGRLARRPGERAEQRALLVEGPVLLGTALDAAVPVDEVYVDEAALDRPAVAAVLDRLDPAVDVWAVPPGVLDRVGDAATSQGTVAVVPWSPSPLPEPITAPFVVVLAEVADPGNVGTLVRAAVASGAGAVVAAGGVDPSSPKVVRSSAGAILSVPITVVGDPASAVAALAAAGYRTVGTVVRDGEPYDRAPLRPPLAVVLGNEAHGLAPEVVGALDHAVTIPMAGPTESLNVAMAGTIVCFEVLRQQRRS